MKTTNKTVTIFKKIFVATLALSLSSSAASTSAIREVSSGRLTWIEISTATIGQDKDNYSLIVLRNPIEEDGYPQIYKHGTWDNIYGHSLQEFWDKNKSKTPLTQAVMPVFGEIEFPFTEPFSPTTTKGTKPRSGTHPLFVLSSHDAIAYLSRVYEVTVDGSRFNIGRTTSSEWPTQCFSKLQMSTDVWIYDIWDAPKGPFGVTLRCTGEVGRSGPIAVEQLGIIPACWIKNQGIQWRDI